MRATFQYRLNLRTKRLVSKCGHRPPETKVVRANTSFRGNPNRALVIGKIDKVMSEEGS